MAWTAGVDEDAGGLVTAAEWNNYLGNASSVDYLKTEMDKLNDCSQSDVTGSRALTTIYQNTSGKPLIVLMSWTMQRQPGGNTTSVDARCDSGSTPTTSIAYIGISPDCVGNFYGMQILIAVPVNYYYRCVAGTGNTPTLDKWIEYQLH